MATLYSKIKKTVFWCFLIWLFTTHNFFKIGLSIAKLHNVEPNGKTVLKKWKLSLDVTEYGYLPPKFSTKLDFATQNYKICKKNSNPELKKFLVPFAVGNYYLRFFPIRAPCCRVKAITLIWQPWTQNMKILLRVMLFWCMPCKIVVNCEKDAIKNTNAHFFPP